MNPGLNTPGELSPLLPKREDLTLTYPTTDDTKTIGVASSVGRRFYKYPKMEDEHLATTFTFACGKVTIPVMLTAVFDGHGGADCSAYAAKNIVSYLQRRLAEFNEETLTDVGVWNALKLALVDLSRTYAGNAGSTANVALQIGPDLWVANLGDSRAILVAPDGTTQLLSEDAKPANKRYKTSVEKRGGGVDDLQNRVNGNLAVARSLGDHDLNGAISARPKIVKVSAPEGGWKGYTLVQFCDGITEQGITSSHVGTAVDTLMKASKSPS